MNVEGIMPAVTTPFDAADRIDDTALRANLRRQLDVGVGAIVALGTMGEHGALSDAERDQVITTIVDECGGECPVIVGVSATRGAIARQHTLRAAALGASAVMSLPPLLYDAQLPELVAHYRAIAQGGLPIMLYNNPGASHSDLPPATIVELAHAVEEIVAVKECSGDARRVAELIERSAGRLEVYVGGDDWALEGLCAGARGWVSGCANPAPQECVALYEHVRDGALDRARELYARLLPLARLDMTSRLVQYYKAALDEVGAAGGPVRPPRLPLDAAGLQVVRAALAALRAPSAA